MSADEQTSQDGFGEALRNDIIRARQALRKLLADRVKLTPVNSPDGMRTDEFEAPLTLGNVLLDMK